MSTFLVIVFLFFMGSIYGWIQEVIFRRLVHKKWINPGFLTGPCLPIYGFGLLGLYTISLIDFSFIGNVIVEKIVVILIIMIAMTLIEYLAGLIFIKGMKIKLWDYSNEWGNIQGIICPLFTLFWGIIGAIYYFFIHNHILGAVIWLSNHLTFSFVLGMFVALLIVDLCYSLNLSFKIRKWAKEHDVIVKLEKFKENVNDKKKALKIKANFMFNLITLKNLREELDNYLKKLKNK